MREPLAGTATVHAMRIDGGTATGRHETLALEVPVACVYNGLSHAVMMASPLDLEDFGLGFSLSEGILARPGELLDIEIVEQADGIALDMRIIESRFQALKDVRRNLTGRTGCGLCGVDSLAAAVRPVKPVTRTRTVQPGEIARAMCRIAELQPLNHATGAIHAAGLALGGELRVREDVGRHNALDKLIGALARESVDASAGILVISSRASYEMVHKAASAGIAIVAAISAPTALAVQIADEAGITLIGFAREQRMTVYSHPDGIVAPAYTR